MLFDLLWHNLLFKEDKLKTKHLVFITISSLDVKTLQFLVYLYKQ